MVSESYPVVTVDRRLGSLIDDFSVDLDQLASIMRGRGFSKQEIAQTIIEFHATTPSTNIFHEAGKQALATGSYDRITDKIGIYPKGQLENHLSTEELSAEFSAAVIHELEHHAVETLEGGAIPTKEECLSMGKSVLKLLAAFPALHEVINRGWDMSARMADIEPSSPAHTAVAIGSIAVAGVSALLFARPGRVTYEQYRASSVEAASFEAEQNAPENLVMIKSKVR